MKKYFCYVTKNCNTYIYRNIHSDQADTLHTTFFGYGYVYLFPPWRPSDAFPRSG